MFTFKPHPIILDPRTNMAMIDEKNSKNFVMLSNDNETVYVQSGACYFGDFDVSYPQDELPQWFWSAYRSLTPQARAACGLRLPEDEAKSLADLSPEFLETFQNLSPALKAQLMPSNAVEVPPEAPRMPQDDTSWEPVQSHRPPKKEPAPPFWDCPECGDTVRKQVKGVHIAKHRRDMYAAERLREQEAMSG